MFVKEFMKTNRRPWKKKYRGIPVVQDVDSLLVVLYWVVTAAKSS